MFYHVVEVSLESLFTGITLIFNLCHLNFDFVSP